MSVLHVRSFIPACIRIALALCLALLAPGCGGKKASKTTPEVLVPSIASEPQPAAEPQSTPPVETNPAPETAPASSAEPAEQKPKPKPHKPVARKPAPPAPAEAAKPEASKPEPAKAPDSSAQITADVPRAAVQSQTQNTEQLLRNSESKLATLNRSLNESEGAMVRQARNYIMQSSEAMRAGDVERAYNLAVKASLLANELAK